MRYLWNLWLDLRGYPKVAGSSYVLRTIEEKYITDPFSNNPEMRTLWDKERRSLYPVYKAVLFCCLSHHLCTERKAVDAYEKCTWYRASFVNSLLRSSPSCQFINPFGLRPESNVLTHLARTTTNPYCCTYGRRKQPRQFNGQVRSCLC